ncbi:hypothetical protein GWI33_011890 [Rhynchophorus ferrugineus]|uniref:Uncharacterized protein n=1 Tax=Rhynchophorus ferrugineus TaxID=354439 RepID=A0A834I919_RHYFE|nr:hypothetical protein GWI33_011890 [Rhynchophorus ferrugineus]
MSAFSLDFVLGKRAVGGAGDDSDIWSGAARHNWAESERDCFAIEAGQACGPCNYQSPRKAGFLSIILVKWTDPTWISCISRQHNRIILGLISD